MNKTLVLGAEAVALGAIDEGISGVYAYPGTPSTEITEYIQKSAEAAEKNIRSEWSANEKTAYEAALGMSYAGKKALVCMKHVGLNVAADAFMNSALTGVTGGMAVVVADDPSMHSSQNEQDTRYYAKFAQIPLLEPSNQQEAYDCTRKAFEMSEKLKLPIIIRLVTRLSHSRSVIERYNTRKQNELVPETDRFKYILVPQSARKRYQVLLGTQKEQEAFSSNSEFNRFESGEGPIGIIAFGLAYNYVKEVLNTYKQNIPLLKISQYPLPEKMVRNFIDQYEKILVVEEGYPIYEELFKGFLGNPKIKGRLDGTLPRTGELNPDIIIQALKIKTHESAPIPEIVKQRPPEFCKGCGHRDLFDALSELMKTYEHNHVFSDIGCYALGVLPPFSAINTCVDMGASITMAKGAADAGLRPAVAVIGDSTFAHSGITGLLDAANDKSPVTIIIADNATTAMTGGQDSAATGNLERLCESVVPKEHIKVIVPLKKYFEENIATMKEEFDYEGVSVIIARRECIQTAKRKKKEVK